MSVFCDVLLIVCVWFLELFLFRDFSAIIYFACCFVLPEAMLVCGVDQTLQMATRYHPNLSKCENLNCFLFAVPTGAPQNFTAIGESPTSVRLQWTLPAKRHCNGEIILYEVLYHQHKQATSDMTTNTTDNSMTLEGLEPLTDYNFQIRAYTNVGPGPWSNRLPFRPFAQR